MGHNCEEEFEQQGNIQVKPNNHIGSLRIHLMLTKSHRLVQNKCVLIKVIQVRRARLLTATEIYGSSPEPLRFHIFTLLNLVS